MSLNYGGERFVPGMHGEGAVDHLHRYVLARKIATGLDVLDIACGEGYGSAILAQVAHKVIGIDINSDTVSHARTNYNADNLRFYHGDCTRLSLEDTCVDLVVSFETIEHHDQHIAMMREIRRVLRPDGVLLISSPNRPEFNRDRSEPYPFHVKELDYDEFNALLRAEFCNIDFYGQRSLSGSLSVPMDTQDALFSCFDEGMEGRHGLSRPIYYLALASNGALPKLGASLFEGHQTKEYFKSAPAVLELRAYFACVGDPGYDQSHSYGVPYPESGKRQTIKLYLQANSQVQKIRLDLSNAPSAIFVHGISLHQDGGTVLWDWDYTTSPFANIGGISIRSTPAGLLFLCWNDDPQFDLALPSEILDNLQPSAYLVVEMTPRSLHEICAEILGQDNRLAELRGTATNETIAGTLDAGEEVQPRMTGVSKSLKEVASLLTNCLASRDQIIADQSMRIRVMREELIRAEAQLDLLKDVMLGGHEEDRL